VSEGRPRACTHTFEDVSHPCLAVAYGCFPRIVCGEIGQDRRLGGVRRCDKVARAMRLRGCAPCEGEEGAEHQSAHGHTQYSHGVSLSAECGDVVSCRDPPTIVVSRFPLAPACNF
jgi:hypothetical protein